MNGQTTFCRFFQLKMLFMISSQTLTQVKVEVKHATGSEVASSHRYLRQQTSDHFTASEMRWKLRFLKNPITFVFAFPWHLRLMIWFPGFPGTCSTGSKKISSRPILSSSFQKSIKILMIENAALKNFKVAHKKTFKILIFNFVSRVNLFYIFQKPTVRYKLQRKRCKKYNATSRPRVAWCVLKTKLFYSTFKKRSSLLHATLALWL
jgi:hypothetical protein